VTGTDFQQTPEKAAKAAFFMSGERRGHGIVQKLNPNRDKHEHVGQGHLQCLPLKQATF
jgi:hypothetical protein